MATRSSSSSPGRIPCAGCSSDHRRGVERARDRSGRRPRAQRRAGRAVAEVRAQEHGDAAVHVLLPEVDVGLRDGRLEARVGELVREHARGGLAGREQAPPRLSRRRGPPRSRSTSPACDCHHPSISGAAGGGSHPSGRHRHGGGDRHRDSALRHDGSSSLRRPRLRNWLRTGARERFRSPCCGSQPEERGPAAERGDLVLARKPLRGTSSPSRTRSAQPWRRPPRSSPTAGG